MYEDNRRSDRPLSKQIRWARSLNDHQIAVILGAELMKSRAGQSRESTVSLMYELVHEMKYRFERFDRIPKQGHDGHDDDEDGLSDED